MRLANGMIALLLLSTGFPVMTYAYDEKPLELHGSICLQEKALASLAMIRRHIFDDFEATLYSFHPDSIERVRPAVIAAYQFPLIRDDGKSRGEFYRAYATMVELSCEAVVDFSLLDKNRHDPLTGQRIQ